MKPKQVPTLSGNETREMTVEAVVRQLGVTPRTLRYYEEVGLITPTARTNGGHRLYDQRTVDQLAQILRLKKHMGLSLQEIKDILEAEKSLAELRQSFQESGADHNKQRDVVLRYIQVLRGVIGKIDAKLENLSKMRDTYQDQLERSIRFLQNS